MPVLPNAKHERFAQEIAKGKSASEAYVIAGYSKNDGNAIRLKGNERIRARIEELQAKVAAKAEITLEWLIEKAEEARIKAMKVNQISAAVGAIKEIGILSGKRVEKSEVAQKRGLGELSDEELQRIATGGGAPVDFEAPGPTKPDPVH